MEDDQIFLKIPLFNEGLSNEPNTNRLWTWECIHFHHQQCGREIVSLSTGNVCVDIRVYPFPPPAGCEHKSVSFSTTSSMDERLFPFPRSMCVDVRGYPFSPQAGCEQEGVLLSTTAVWTRSCIPFHSQQCGRVGVFLSTLTLQSNLVNSVEILWTWGCFPFHHQECGREGVSLSAARMQCGWQQRWASTLASRSNAQSGIGMLRYRNEMLGAGIPMPAALVSMPMPSYVYKAQLKWSFCFTYFNAEFPSLIPLEYKPCNTTM